jgi:hypothetical protein
MELVDMLDLGSSALRRESSSLSLGTNSNFVKRSLGPSYIFKAPL